MDTTRADHLSAYGYAQPTTPYLEAFAKRAILFERAYSTSSWTVPSHASLFTGLFSISHEATQESRYLASEFETIAELLSEAGYATVAFSNNSLVGTHTNLLQGFAEIHELWRDKAIQSTGEINATIRDWAKGHDHRQPFFLFINYINPHWNYDAPRILQDKFADPSLPAKARRQANFRTVDWYAKRPAYPKEALELRIALYDAEVAYVDEAVGELLATLSDLSLFENSLIVITADHGEALGENGHQGHTFTLYDTVVRIPMLIRPPGGAGAGTRRSNPVQLTDVFSTIAAAAGVKPTSSLVAGRDLFNRSLPMDHPILAEYYYPDQYLAFFPKRTRSTGSLAPYARRIRSILVNRHKFIWGSDGRHELYDTASDPGEKRNLIDEEPEVAKQLATRLDGLIERYRNNKPAATPSEIDMDPETQKNLRELGYIE
jgi:arylsulfatase A-like enzyme